MRITLDCGIWGIQSYGGISNYWNRVFTYLSSESPDNLQIIAPRKLLYRGISDDSIRQSKYIEETLPSKFSRYLPVYIPNFREGDIFHTPYYRLPLVGQGKFIVSVYDFTYEKYRDGFSKSVHSLQKFSSLSKADKIVCISDSTRNDLNAYLPNIDSSKVETIHLGVDCLKYYVDKNLSNTAFSEKEKSMLKSGAVVLFVGQRRGYKRFDLAVEALMSDSDLILGVVGPQLSASEKEMLSLNLGKRWIEFGAIDDVLLRKAYSYAFSFIFPSDYEGFGLPVLEAMACGCPTVIANLSSFPEVGGKAALYAYEQSGEGYHLKLVQLKDRFLRAEVITLGFVNVLKFPWESCMKKTLACYSL
jgi:mannosyltransferase